MKKINSKENILQVLAENRTAIKEYGVSKIELFGSYVRNEQDKNSDIDLAVEFIKDKKTYKNYIRLIYYLQDLFQTDIDLITLKSLPENRNFSKEILKETVYVSL